MKKITSYYIYPEDGKRLIENGKDVGVLVIAPKSKDLSVFQNVKEIKTVVEFVADEGKVFKNKTTGEFLHIVPEKALEEVEEVEEEIEGAEEIEETEEIEQ